MSILDYIPIISDYRIGKNAEPSIEQQKKLLELKKLQAELQPMDVPTSIQTEGEKSNQLNAFAQKVLEAQDKVRTQEMPTSHRGFPVETPEPMPQEQIIQNAGIVKEPIQAPLSQVKERASIEKIIRPKVEKIPMPLLPAISSGYALPEKVKTLFPDLPLDRLEKVSVGMVQDKEKLLRAIEMSKQRPATSEELKDLATGDVMRTQLDNLWALGDKTKWEGVGLDAPMYKAGQYAPEGSGLTTDPDITEFYSTLDDLKNQIIYLRSGKQINEKEYERLQKAMPKEMTNKTTFIRDLQRFQQTFEDVMISRESRISSAGRRTGESGTETPQPKKTEPKTFKDKVLNAQSDPLGIRGK